MKLVFVIIRKVGDLLSKELVNMDHRSPYNDHSSLMKGAIWYSNSEGEAKFYGQ